MSMLCSTSMFFRFCLHYQHQSAPVVGKASAITTIKMLKIQMLEQILTKESVDEELRLSTSSSGHPTPVDEDGRSLSTASLRTHKPSSSSQNSTPSMPIAVMAGFVPILLPQLPSL